MLRSGICLGDLQSHVRLLSSLRLYTDPIFVIFSYRLLLHFSNKSGYDGEDIKIFQLVFSFAFIVFGFTVDFFIDWPFMMLYFIFGLILII